MAYTQKAIIHWGKWEATPSELSEWNDIVAAQIETMMDQGWTDGSVELTTLDDGSIEETRVCLDKIAGMKLVADLTYSARIMGRPMVSFTVRTA